jgi:hypothetical protein
VGAIDKSPRQRLVHPSLQEVGHSFRSTKIRKQYSLPPRTRLYPRSKITLGARLPTAWKSFLYSIRNLPYLA